MKEIIVYYMYSPTELSVGDLFTSPLSWCEGRLDVVRKIEMKGDHTLVTGDYITTPVVQKVIAYLTEKKSGGFYQIKKEIENPNFIHWLSKTGISDGGSLKIGMEGWKIISWKL